MDVILLLLIVLLLFLVIAYHWRLQRKEKRQIAFQQVWWPLLEQSMEQVPERLPILKTRDTINFLLLWNSMQDNLLGEVKENLNQVARQLKIDAIALKYLTKGNFTQRLLSINTLGHLREAAAWPELRNIVVTNEQQVMVLMAAKAMAAIDEWQAAEVFIPLVALHKEWPTADVGAVLERLKPKAVDEVLGNLILRTLVVDVPRLLRFLRFATPGAAVETALVLLERYNNAEIIAGCLSVLADCDDGQHIALARSYAVHSSWVVRLQAVNMFSKIGRREDIPVLVGMLADPEWWVRHRSARALIGLSILSGPEIQEIIATQTDKYAIDALNQALVEKRILSYGLD
jgi:HEAT repeat protein